MENETRSLTGDDKKVNKFLAEDRVENQRQLATCECSRALTSGQRTLGGPSCFVSFKVEIKMPCHTTPVGTFGCRKMAKQAEEVSQSVKCVVCKPEDLGSYPLKARVVACDSNLTLEKWEQEDLTSWLIHSVNSRCSERDCLKKI